MRLPGLLALVALAGAVALASPYDVRVYLWVRLTVANNSTSPHPLPPLLVELPLNDTHQFSRLLNFTVRVGGSPLECGSRMIAGDCGSRYLEVACPAQLPPKSTAELEVVALVEVRRFRAPELSFEASGRLAEIPRDLAWLTAPSGPWRYDHPSMRYLAEAASAIAGGEERVLTIVAKLVDWIWRKVEYDVGKGPRYPNETLPPERLEAGRGRGDCDDQANLLILMLRSLGVPAYLKTALVADFNYREARVIWSPEGHYYYAFYGIDYGHAWAEVYVPPWGWLPVDLTFHATTGDPLDAIRTSAPSDAWAWQTIVTVRIGDVCREDYIAEFRRWAAEIASTPLFYYEEYAVVREGDSIARVKSFLRPLPLPWVRRTEVEVRYPSRALALETLKLNGSLTPGLANATILLHVRKPSGRTVSLETRTDREGKWTLELHLDEAGAWSLNATFPGLPGYAPSSRGFTVYVDKRPSELVLQASQRGGELALEGRLNPPVDTNLTLIVTAPSGLAKPYTVGLVNGTFALTVPAVEPGRYRVSAFWPGNEVFEHAAATVEALVEVPTRLEIEAVWSEGRALVRGVLKPAVEGATILVEAVSEGRRVERRVTVSPDGTFTVELELDEGEWTVSAVFEGAPGYGASRASTHLRVPAVYSPGLLLAAAAALALGLLVIALRRRKLLL
ncbi:MAG: transglutaminase-like domain-containing protein [Thermofilaceae archaeon]